MAKPRLGAGHQPAGNARPVTTCEFAPCPSAFAVFLLAQASPFSLSYSTFLSILLLPRGSESLNSLALRLFSFQESGKLQARSSQMKTVSPRNARLLAVYFLFTVT